MWAALLGAVVGGFFAIAGSVAVELRRDRRRQLGAARLVVSRLEWSAIEIQAASDAEQWHEGPHPAIRTLEWETHAADLVGRLRAHDFAAIDETHTRLAQAASWGFTASERASLVNDAHTAAKILAPLARLTWIDRHVWRL